jgi:hypothetical protein
LGFYFFLSVNHSHEWLPQWIFLIRLPDTQFSPTTKLSIKSGCPWALVHVPVSSPIQVVNQKVGGTIQCVSLPKIL